MENVSIVLQKINLKSKMHVSVHYNLQGVSCPQVEPRYPPSLFRTIKVWY